MADIVNQFTSIPNDLKQNFHVGLVKIIAIVWFFLSIIHFAILPGGTVLAVGLLGMLVIAPLNFVAAAYKNGFVVVSAIFCNCVVFVVHIISMGQILDGSAKINALLAAYNCANPVGAVSAAMCPAIKAQLGQYNGYVAMEIIYAIMAIALLVCAYFIWKISGLTFDDLKNGNLGGSKGGSSGGSGDNAAEPAKTDAPSEPEPIV